MPEPTLLDVDGLSVVIPTRHGDVAALSGVALQVASGEIVGLVGESGGGKSMVARSIVGLLPPRAEVDGTVSVDGRDVLRMGSDELADYRGRGAALCFQTPRRALSPTVRAGRQVKDRLHTHQGLSGKALDAAAVSAFEEVGIRDPERRLRAFPHELSGGMCQRVMIALSLACGPQLLLADEPTTGLDVTLTREILRLFRRAADEHHAGVLLISHDVAAISEIADRLVVLYAGTVVEEGPTGQLIAEPRHPYTRALLGSVPRIDRQAEIRALPGVMPRLHTAPASCPFAPRCGLAEDVCRRELPHLEQVAPRRRAACFRADAVGTAEDDTLAGTERRTTRRVVPADAPPLLSLSDVELTYPGRFGSGGHRALRGVDLEVRVGETVGVVGESGCGKSTLARVISALLPPTAGTARFDGVDMATLRSRARRRLRQRMQIVFQDPVDALNPRHEVWRAIAEPLRLAGITGAEAEERIDAAFERVRLEPALRNRRPHELSGGQAQRVGIARALAPDPELVVLDEPTASLDVTVQAQILALLEGLTAEGDRAYVYISHDLATVRNLSHRVVVLYLGQVVEEGPVEQVFSRPLHPYTRALLSNAPRLDASRPPWAVDLERDLDEATDVAGCPLTSRCPFATSTCAEMPQPLQEFGPDHRAACWRVPEIDTEATPILTEGRAE